MERNKVIDKALSELIRLTTDLVSEAGKAEKKLALLSEERIIAFLTSKGESVYWIDSSLEVRTEPDDGYRRVNSVRLKDGKLFVTFTDGVRRSFSKVNKSDAVRILKVIDACEEYYVRRYRVTVSEVDEIIISESQLFPTWVEANEVYERKTAEMSEKYPNVPGRTRTEEKDEDTRTFIIRKRNGESYVYVTLDVCYAEKK